jgi:glycosyltransferase involved in cell wall biosynthesis
VGRGSLAAVENAAAKFPTDKIIFAGWRSDIPACLNAMDMFVQPSLSEAFSQVLIEAMGTGLPVIATNVGGASEVIDAGINGILIEPNSPDAIYAEVCGLYRDAPYTVGIANAGMLSVRERFTVDQMIERQFGLYQSWMGQS